MTDTSKPLAPVVFGSKAWRELIARFYAVKESE